MAGRCVPYPPHAQLLLLDGIVFTELVNSRFVGYSEVTAQKPAGRVNF